MSRLFSAASLVSRACVKDFSTSVVGRSGKPDLTKIKKKQAHFQIDDGLPVFLKGGPADTYLYYLTVALTAFGFGVSVHSLYKLAAANTLRRHGSKVLRSITHNIRKRSTDDACPPKTEPCPPPPPKPDGTCPQPPPCPPIPPCPPTLCHPNPDPNNPCNYCPPPCYDPDTLDFTRLKKLQCKFQEDNDIPVFLKGGKSDVILYQITVILTIFGVLNSFYLCYKLANK